MNLTNDKIKKVRDAVGLLLKKGAQKDVNYVKKIILLCSLLETSKQVSLNRKEIYGNYCDFVLKLD